VEMSRSVPRATSEAPARESKSRPSCPQSPKDSEAVRELEVSKTARGTSAAAAADDDVFYLFLQKQKNARA
jgi:hypothetical protein